MVSGDVEGEEGLHNVSWTRENRAIMGENRK